METSVPCFHFDVLGDDPGLRLGLELADLSTARIEAARLAGAMILEDPERFWEGPGWRLDVRNCDDQLLFAIDVSSRKGDPGAVPRTECPAHLLESV